MSYVDAQYYFFGRNKVQYEDFEWQVIKTDHFDIYYYGEFEEIAEIGAKFAEEAYDELKVKFNHLVVTRIPLIFYNTHIHFQQTNTLSGFIPEGVGGFFEFLKGRVVIPYLGSIDKFRHVIRHELVHVFMTSKVLNVMKDHRIPAERYPPLWFVEGIAEYWSTTWDTQAEMVMRDAVLNNRFVPLSQISRIYGSFQMYKQGQHFLEFVANTYGEDKILMILENFWRFNKFSEILEFTLGDRIEVIDEKWEYSLKQRYYPLYENRFPHTVQAKKITNEGFNFSPNFYSGNGENEIIYLGNKQGYSSLYKMPYKPDETEYADSEVLVRGEKEDVFESFHILQPSVAVHNGGTAAFITKSKMSDMLHFYDLKEDEYIKGKRFDELITIKAPEFSREGDRMVFSATDAKGFSDIYLYDIGMDKLSRLTNDYYEDSDPVLDSSGTFVYFVSDRTGGKYEKTNNLFRISTSTLRTEYVTYINANFNSPGFSPDYKTLYVNCDIDGNFNLYKLEKDQDDNPKGITQQTHFLTSLFDFTFANNNELITSAFENFSFHFYSLKLNKIPDSLKIFTPNEFHFVGRAWEEEKIVVDIESDRLRYENSYSLDYAVSQVITDPVYGTRGGALLTLSDLLGNDKYLFLLYNTAEVTSEVLRSFNVAITRINSAKRSNYGYGVFHYNGRRYDLRESNTFYYERSFGGFFSLLYPFSSFQRIEASVSLANSDKELPEEAFINRKSLLLSNTISFVHDNSLWGPSGPIDGSRFRVLLGYTSDIKYSNANYYSFIVDYRKYLRLTTRSAIATRASLFYNDGKEARRYFAGGSWDLRGWPRWSIRGEKLWLSSVELRFPLVDVLYLKLPIFGLAFTSIRGAFYLDAGGAWDNKYSQTLGSIGTGIRINLFNAIAFRYDIGKKIENDFNTLQPGLFYQFFFGWDF
ncbi:MAG: peptidase S9 [Melioribacteraceae bacterium]|nr:MAG: peptidase S9 [Melioribacteraceae bacterium]